MEQASSSLETETQPIRHTFRGHRLLWLEVMFRTGRSYKSSSDIAAESVSYIREHDLTSSDNALAAYARSVVGTTLRQAELTQQNQEHAYQSFMDGEDDEIFEVVEGITDTICDGCWVSEIVQGPAEHCRSRYNCLGGGTDLWNADKNGVNMFLERIDELGLTSQIQIVEQPVTFLDAPPEMARRVITTVGVAKHLFASDPHYFYPF